MAQQKDTRLARVRSRYTAERHTEALAGVRAHGLVYGLVPAAVDAEQQLLEARVLHALATAFGAHVPTEVGGPFGLMSVSPEPERLVIRCTASAAVLVVSALVTWREDDGGLMGRSGLRARIDDRGRLVVHHPQLNGQIILVGAPAEGEDNATMTTSCVAEAAATLPEPPSLFDDPSLLFEPPMDPQVERTIRAKAPVWSTAFRRLGLFADAPTVDFTGDFPTPTDLMGPDPSELAPSASGRPQRSGRRWVLTAEVEALLDGQGLRGLEYPDLWTWLYEQRSPTSDCDWCGEPVDARVQDASIHLVMTAWDPDLCPMTQMLSSTMFHAGCRPSRVSWARRVDLDSSPTSFALAIDGHEDEPGEFLLTVRPLVLWDDDDAEDPDGGRAALLLVGRVTRGEPVRAWQDALGMHLRGLGFTTVDGIDGSDGWAVRAVVDGERPWVAIRQPVDEDGFRAHFWLGHIDPPSPRWVQLARRSHEVLLIAGPDRLPDDEDGAATPAGLDDQVNAVVEQLDDMLEDGTLLVCPAGLVPGP